MQFEAFIQVSSRPAAVFSVLSDYQQDPRWRSGVVTMAPQPPGAAQAGTSTDEVIRFLGITTRTPGQVTELVDGELLARRVHRAAPGGRGRGRGRGGRREAVRPG